MKRMQLIPIVLELIGIGTIGTGIGLELAQGGTIYLVIITTGSCLVALGGVIYGKIMRKERR